MNALKPEISNGDVMKILGIKGLGSISGSFGSISEQLSSPDLIVSNLPSLPALN
jgi:hypothetical protein